MVDSKVKVAVRVRPMNQREIDLKSECVVYMEGKQTVLKFTSHTYEGNCKAQKEFVFDHCFWSVDDEGPATYTSQEDIFKTIGEDILDSIFAGFNSCIFAYGQTGSGKTFSMMGTDDQPGLVPRLCSSLFRRDINHLKSLQVEAAYLEIYNEKVRDLLYPTSDFKALKVREHKTFGPYVEGLSHHVVSNTEDIKSLILEGNKCRMIANTKMNEHSSRSHAIFTLTVTQTLQVERGVLKELLSKVSLVDLAGSERTSTSGATGDQLKESSNINKSLTFLGLVINSLAELSDGKRKSTYVNYRDSKLTWLLKNNLGGNSKTVMLATISPASVNYQETLSTLNYADSAKRIVNKATVNEDIKSKAITELKEEVKRLREQLQQAEVNYKQELEEKLNESEKLLRDLKVSWEEKLKKTEMSALERQNQLQNLGITVEHTGIRVDKDKCYLINLSTNSDQNELFLHYLGGKTKIGAGDSQDIKVIGPRIELEHCMIDIEDGKVFLTPNKNAETFVNSLRVLTVVTLSHEDRIQLGTTVSFILCKPNSKPTNTKEEDDAVNVLLNEPEEQNPPGNDSIHEESDMSVGPDISDWSYRDNSSEPLCTFSNDSRIIGSSSQKDDISQNRSIVSPEISHNKHLEDQDSCDRKNTTIEIKVSPNENKNDDRNPKLILPNELKKSDTDAAVDNDGNKMEIFSNLTIQTKLENLSCENRMSKEDNGETDFSISSTSVTKMEQNRSFDNMISKDNDKIAMSFDLTSQVQIEQHFSGKQQISKDDDDHEEDDNKINEMSINSTSQTEMEQNLKSYKEIPKREDTTDVPITQTSQNKLEQILGNESQICKDDNKMGSSKQASQTENEQNIRSQSQISKDYYDISINTSQADMETDLSSVKQIDSTKIPIKSISQAEIVQDLSTKKQITKNNDDKNDLSITSTSQAEMRQDLSGESQISKEDDDKTDISINLSSQAEIEQKLRSQNQNSKYIDKIDISIIPTTQTETVQNICMERETSKGDNTDDISITPTCETEMEQNVSSEHQISKDDDKTDFSITSTSQGEMEANITSTTQITKEDDVSDVSLTLTSQAETKHHLEGQNQQSKDKEDKTDITIFSTFQAEMEQNTRNQVSKEEHNITDVSIIPTTRTETLQSICMERETSKDDNTDDISITATYETEMDENVSSEHQISKDDDVSDLSTTSTSQAEMEQNTRNQVSKEEHNITDVSIIPTTRTETLQSICMERETSKDDDDKSDIFITSTSQAEMEQQLRSQNQNSKDNDKIDISIIPITQTETLQSICMERETSKEDNTDDISITPTCETEMDENVSSEHQISKDDDVSDLSTTSTSQAEMEQHSGDQISKVENNITDVFITSISQAEIEQNNSGKSQISKDEDEKSDIFITSTSQAEIEQELRSQNQKSKDNDKIDISIIPIPQTETLLSICMERETSKEDNTDDISITPICQTEIEQNVSSEHQISKDDDVSDLSTTSTSQGEMEANTSSAKQISKEDDVSDVSLTLTSQAETKHHLEGQNQQSKDKEDKTDITLFSTSQAEMEQNTGIQISQEEHNITDGSITSISQAEIEQNTGSQITKGDDKIDISITSISQTENKQIERNIRNLISKSGDKTDIFCPAAQAEIEENTDGENQIFKGDEFDISINPISKTEMEQNIRSKSKTSSEEDRNDTPTSPAELFLEDNITRSASSPGIHGTSERHTGAAMVAGSSDQAVNYIRRSRKEIMAALQKNFDDFLDDCDSMDIITQEEYRKVENTSSVKQKARSLLNIILEKDEATCRAFLQCLHLNQDEKDFPWQETKKSHIEEPKEVNTDKDLSVSTYEDIHLPKANLKIEPKKLDKRTCFQDLLMKMNFQSYQKSKLTLHDVLDIGVECVRTDFSPMENVAWNYIRKLMSLHKEARNISTIGNRAEISKNSSLLLDVDCDMSGSIHPLDLQCTILHCSDHFLQQEMISKMSMCQFSVPLLLPASDGPDCTFMLWAMRGIVKKWRPQSLSESRGFQEEHLVKISMPTFSFMRLGKCRLSKSNILNKILTSTQHYQDIFVHRDMDGGNVERNISMGLVEMSWYFPAGKGIFAEPVAFTNLRGELENNVKTFGFLAEISSVVVIFAEAVSKTQCELLLKYRNSKTTFLYIIVPEEQKSREEIEDILESVVSMTETKKDNVLVITKSTNEAATVKKIHSALMKLEKENCNFLSIEDMAETAIEQGICVDEREKECQAAEKKAKAITEEISDVVNYKEKTMKLQAQLLRDLAKLEKELCQMKQQHNKNGEKYKSELRRKCDDIRRKQWECHMPEGIVQFMKGIGTKNRSEKFYFLSWLKYYLDLAARKTLTSLQEIYKEKYSQARNSKELTEIDQKISDSSLGIEHFMREMSQFYEVWNFIGKHQMECEYLSEAAADLLLDGYPLELIDGDASRIPVQWVTDILNKVNTKTGDRCRIRVITVLGVQSTGKSTLLNTMFGLQYPVASGRCTRGAFMTLIKVKENIQVELGCEYLLVIDTEGLKAPELDSLEGSYEHDNELATLVVGLSDITVINMAMENITEMKDIIQIVIHSFLRMKEIGKKPNCQFVHQNVSDVSAHEKNMRDRNKLLEQLNEMTRTVATMEKKPQYKVFSDVMEYDSEQHHWYIPSLWQGVPPMAPVSAGYSEHIAELKLNLLKMIKQSQTGAQTIPQFVKWTEDLWNAVKHENFIFSFRNSLVASAYNKLSMKYSELEWKFNKLIHEWLTNTETIIKNQSEDTLEDKGKECCIKLENIISVEQNKMITWVEDYFQQNKDCINLIRYKEDFINSAKMLGKNLRMSSQDKYINAMQIQKQQHKIKKVRMQYIEGIEHKVSSLMEDCRKKQHQLDNAKLTREFEIMWQDTVKELGVTPLIKHDIEKDMLLELTKTMRDRGSAVNEKLNQTQHLPKPEKKHTGGKMKSINTFFKSPYKWWKGNMKHEDIIQSVLEKCCRYSEEQARKDGDYDDTYCKQLLNIIDDSLTKEGNIPAEQELDIKLKILGHVVDDFQEMHNNFIKKNDPHSQLDTLKSEYFNSFMDVFQEKNESQNLAKRICDTCLKPAIIDHIIRNLGIELVDDIMRSEGSATYTSRTFFQYTVLLDLLEENKFKKYVKYSRNYEKFVKNWILKYVKRKYKNFITMEIKILSGITEKIRDVLISLEMWDHNLEDFLDHFQDNLSSDLVFPKEKMKAIIFKNSANTKEFIKNLNNFLSDTKEEILSELEALGRDVILSRVSVKPQDELFKKVFGCGKQCPFCKVPCEAGGEDHKEHFASVHRPKGLGTYRCSESLILCHDICTTSVCENGTFMNSDTNEKPHPYKKYKDYYPDWRIQPDPSIKAADYWKFVLKEFNDQFASQYHAKPADYPKEWNNLTKEMAKESLKKTFNM